ncbi:dUTPase [Fusobacterium necrophorum]|uniref:dUTPase n=1 Tax=Fusobacterium TaxID=848 RepID=UPI0001BC65D7|nr:MULTISPECIES: dUTPase [Fusobacterium]AVQ16325.1 hypothetical protein C4N16_01730 [Fusobacterium gonidiaformans ATCC 25563]EFS28895.1 hypothetical protein FGAG_01216 [Fusobacterium gonidiaformans ATCC 25563]MDK4474585.1 dUTPase [Fusobacterium necrophorum]MDK4496057.1 dUTPase [Fusobacterium necrophorum]MDK4503558.1 dUTPase [Fusobacterium necrophorum]
MKKDRLKEIWDRQKHFDDIVLKRIGKTKGEVSNDIKVALTTELGELYNENPTFKFWKEQKNIEITDKTREEFADCLHFLISIGQDIFKNEEEMFQWYCNKNDKNLMRQNNGY